MNLLADTQIVSYVKWRDQFVVEKLHAVANLDITDQLNL